MVGIQLPSATSMTRRAPPRQRTYLVDCKVCHTWSSVPTLKIQSICREAGVCVGCMRNDYHMLKVRIAAIECAMEWLVKRAKKLPEEQRAPLRTVYAKKAKQLTTARQQLAALEART